MSKNVVCLLSESQLVSITQDLQETKLLYLSKVDEIKSLERENEKLNHDLKEIKQKYEILIEKEKSIQEDNMILEAQLSEIESQKSDQERRIQRLHEKLATEINCSRETQRKYQIQVENLERTIDKLENDLRTVKQDTLKLLEDEIVSLRLTITNYEKESTIGATIKQDNERLQKQLEEMQIQLIGYERKIDKLERDLITPTQDKLKLLEDEIPSLRLTIANYEKESTLAATIKEDYERLQKQLEEMKIQIIDYESLKEKHIMISEDVIILKQEIEDKNLKIVEIENSQTINNNNENESLKVIFYF